MTLESALSGVPFSIDQFRCYQAARELSAYRSDKPEGAWSSAPVDDQFVFKILFISICHQFNWDFMQDALARHLLPDARSRLPEFAETGKCDIESWLEEYPKQERVRGAERARMLRQTANDLIEAEADRKFISEFPQRARLEGECGFYAEMARFKVYRMDVVEKKARVLAHDLFREEIVRFSDPEHLKPAVEYHLLRLYLRTGRVYPTHESVKKYLTTEISPERDRLVRVLRDTVAEAMSLTAFYSGLDAATLNYLEWQIARSVCLTVSPHCVDVNKAALPSDVAALFTRSCIFSQDCRTLKDPQYGFYHEPHFHKAIY